VEVEVEGKEEKQNANGIKTGGDKGDGFQMNRVDGKDEGGEKCKGLFGSKFDGDEVNRDDSKNVNDYGLKMITERLGVKEIEGKGIEKAANGPVDAGVLWWEVATKERDELCI